MTPTQPPRPEQQAGELVRPLIFIYNLPGNGNIRLVKESAYDALEKKFLEARNKLAGYEGRKL